MTGKFHTLLFCLAALLVGAGASRAASGTAPAARGAASYTLQDVMNAPDAFAGSDVYFYCRFAGISKLFKPAQTRLSPTEFVNFAAWPFRAELWTADGRKNNLPTLYLAKKDHAQLDVMRSLKKYDLVAVSGRVVSAYSGVPWIEVRRIEPVGQAGAVLTDLVVREMRTGHDALLVEDAAAASACFERILALELPADVFAAACEYSARASIMLGNTAMARDRLVMAVKAGRDEPDVRLAIADLSLKLGDPERALAESRHAVAVPALRIAALGVAAEANAQQGRHAEALAALAAAGDSSRLSPRDEATLDLYRARIHTMSGRTGEAEQLYSAQTLPDAPAVDRKSVV